MFEEYNEPDILDFISEYRRQVELDDTQEILLPRLVQGEEFYIAPEIDEEFWFYPMVISREFFNSMDDREVIQYMNHNCMTVQ